ncbi:olfactory receptor 6C76-like [Rattus rattus]|uniref:olfactory receptor 6C76-like n=1 Tax=Rattus rattus TaxID=10117 RepID=UPI0013F395C8|nr:olfactory receptor 6C76-like [Rattus rattus]
MEYYSTRNIYDFMKFAGKWIVLANIIREKSRGQSSGCSELLVTRVWPQCEQSILPFAVNGSDVFLQPGFPTVLICFVVLFLGATVFFLMAVLSLDRFLAICKPLHYLTIMSPRMCFLLITVSLVLGFLFMASPVAMLFQTFYCGPNVIPHFFCDFGPLANLSCSETRSIEMLFFNLAFIVLFTSLLITIFAYINIVVTIVRLPSARERQRAFSTCSSHLIVLSLMFGSSIFIYMKPKQRSRVDNNREAALVNTVFTPLLNPVIYTLRNQQVHQALRDALSRVQLHRYQRSNTPSL